MKLKKLAQTLDDIRHENGDEYWYARELFPLLGYQSYRSFKSVIERAKEACQNSGQLIHNHFAGVRKMVKLGSGALREIEDVTLSRYACYLIAQNGDPRIPEIAFAQMYFALQTRKQELIEQSAEEIERLVSRRQLTETEKEFVSEIYKRGVRDATDIARIKSSGDEKLFGGLNTRQMKRKLGVKRAVPLPDVLPSVTLKAKDLATEMTTVNSRSKSLYGASVVKNEHDENNESVRRTLTQRGIYPERLPAAENTKRIESRHRRMQKQLAKEMIQSLPDGSES
ncbi:MAG: DNA damage-inducible protein D [bacterium]|nr:DNA damage-inducible protein D [bacterium]